LSHSFSLSITTGRLLSLIIHSRILYIKIIYLIQQTIFQHATQNNPCQHNYWQWPPITISKREREMHDDRLLFMRTLDYFIFEEVVSTYFLVPRVIRNETLYMELYLFRMELKWFENVNKRFVTTNGCQWVLAQIGRKLTLYLLILNEISTDVLKDH
jgi:hypothetical protein